MAWTFNRERLIALRESRGMTLEEFSERLGGQRQQVHQWETGEHVPHTNTLVKIANTFDVVPAYFFTKKEETADPAATQHC